MFSCNAADTGVTQTQQTTDTGVTNTHKNCMVYRKSNPLMQLLKPHVLLLVPTKKTTTKTPPRSARENVLQLAFALSGHTSCTHDIIFPVLCVVIKALEKTSLAALKCIQLHTWTNKHCKTVCNKVEEKTTKKVMHIGQCQCNTKKMTWIPQIKLHSQNIRLWKTYLSQVDEVGVQPEG